LLNSEVVREKIVVRYLRDRHCKMLFLFGDVTLGARQPAGHDVIGGFFAISWGNIGEGPTRGIELSKTQRDGGEIQLTVEIVVAKTGDLGAPGNGGIAILFFGRLRQSIKGRQGMRIELRGLLRDATGLVKFLLAQKCAGLSEQTFFPPLIIDSASR